MRNLLLVAAVALSTTGCGIIYKQPIYQGNLIREDAVAKLQVGQSKQQVTALLGTPSVPDPFHAQRWDYTSTERVNRLGRTDVKNFVVYFENDVVTRWEGDYFPANDKALAQQTVRQFGRNLPKDKKKKGGRRATLPVLRTGLGDQPPRARRRRLSLGSACRTRSSSTRSPSSSTCCGRASTPCTATAGQSALPSSPAAATASALSLIHI